MGKDLWKKIDKFYIKIKIIYMLNLKKKLCGKKYLKEECNIEGNIWFI